MAPVTRSRRNEQEQRASLNERDSDSRTTRVHGATPSPILSNVRFEHGDSNRAHSTSVKSILEGIQSSFANELINLSNRNHQSHQAQESTDQTGQAGRGNSNPLHSSSNPGSNNSSPTPQHDPSSHSASSTHSNHLEF